MVWYGMVWYGIDFHIISDLGNAWNRETDVVLAVRSFVLLLFWVWEEGPNQTGRTARGVSGLCRWT